MFSNNTANYPGALRAGSHSKTLQQNDIPEAFSGVHSSGTPEIATKSVERCAIVIQPIRRHTHRERAVEEINVTTRLESRISLLP
jgi:hypothetical protein